MDVLTNEQTGGRTDWRAGGQGNAERTNRCINGQRKWPMGGRTKTTDGWTTDGRTSSLFPAFPHDERVREKFGRGRPHVRVASQTGRDEVSRFRRELRRQSRNWLVGRSDRQDGCHRRHLRPTTQVRA